MKSRMDKYNTNDTPVKTRTQKNQNLYNDVRNSSLTEFDVNSNVSVIDNQANIIDVQKIRKMLDKRYSDDTPKRRSIEIPDYDEPIIEEPLADTKEYDINAILEKAKQGKNVDYTKERLKKVREAQYEILNNLDLELKTIEEDKNAKRKQDEENLMNLINTITQLEMKNKKEYNKEASEALELLSDLKGEEEVEEKTEEIEVAEENITEEIEIEEPEAKTEKSRDEHIEETLSKLNIDISSYEDFNDISKGDAGSLILKIIIFIIIVALVFGAVYIVDNILSLGLF